MSTPVAALLLSLLLAASPEGAPPPGSTEPAASERASGPSFWAFQRPTRHPLPDVRDPAWSRRAHDRFVLARLEAAGLAPGPDAAPAPLLRRVSFDLTGLPPDPASVERVDDAASPDAYERSVDALLGSPAFGERWARLWLDVMRYAEDQAHIVGDNKSLFYPNAWRYRDWLIDALNEDVSYDRFVRLQLAADVLEPESTDDIAALGFLGLGPKYYGRGSLAVKADEWEDRVDTVTRGLLGLTVACARCHDHKYDPITTEEYYALAGVFASTDMYNRPLDDGREKSKDGEAKKPEDALHVVREGKPTDLEIFERGDVEKKGPVARRHFLRALIAGEPPPFEQGSGRAELAAAIADRDNPLTARVIVNRVWGELIGKPLVSTPSNFGALGERPTHPELLDDLAVRFMDAGWSLKWLVREIVLSSTYRQSSRARDDGLERDRANTLLWRMNRRRLDVESWRDALLAASGRLDRSIGGASFEARDEAARRRTVYAAVSRLELDSTLALFDFPDPNVHAAKRAATTTPLQKLFVMNNHFMTLQAEGLAARLRAAADRAGDGVDERVGRAYRRLFARAPSVAELELAREFLGDGSDASRWTQYAQALLASNEMMFID